MSERISETAIETLFAPLAANGWTMEDGTKAITKSFTFGDFPGAFAWMTRVALWAEKWDHHPEWRNVWNRVDVRLTTHDVGGLSAKDAKLARKMDQLAEQ